MAKELTRRQIERENAKKAFKALQKNPLNEDVSISLVDDNSHHWTVTLLGTEGSYYENGVFFLDFVFPKQYPVQPPKVKFETRIYHLNITGSGRVCIPLFDDEWEYGVHTVRDVIFEIISLFSDPIADSPINGVAGELYYNKPQLYEKVARIWTKKYATENKNVTFKETIEKMKADKAKSNADKAEADKGKGDKDNKDNKDSNNNNSDNKDDNETDGNQDSNNNSNSNNNNNNSKVKEPKRDYMGDFSPDQYDPMFVINESDLDSSSDDDDDSEDDDENDNDENENDDSKENNNVNNNNNNNNDNNSNNNEDNNGNNSNGNDNADNTNTNSNNNNNSNDNTNVNDTNNNSEMQSAADDGQS